MPPGWNWIFGHLLVFGKYAAELPPDVYVLLGNAQIGCDMGKDVYMLDLWPKAKPMMFIGSLELANAVVIKHNYPRTVLFRLV